MKFLLIAISLFFTGTSFAASHHQEHTKHSHKHESGCGHVAEWHVDHFDYDHDNHDHHSHGNHAHEAEGINVHQKHAHAHGA